jgi:hypothetical protein
VNTIYSKRTDVNNNENGSLAIATLLEKIFCKYLIKSAHVRKWVGGGMYFN